MNRLLVALLAGCIVVAACAPEDEVDANGHPKSRATASVTACNAYPTTITYFGNVEGDRPARVDDDWCLRVQLVHDPMSPRDPAAPEGWVIYTATAAPERCGALTGVVPARAESLKGSIVFEADGGDPRSADIDLLFAAPALSDRPSLWMSGRAADYREGCP